MGIEIAVSLILGFIIIYVLFIEVFSVLFRITGLTKEKAKFQAISLLTGCGFTTNESEVITTDKARRKIAVVAMITGYAFSAIIVSLIITLISSVVGMDKSEIPFEIIVLIFIIFVTIIFILQLPFVKKPIEKLIEIIAVKVFRKRKNSNTITMLDNYGNDAIAEVLVRKAPQELEEKTLFEANIRDDYKINILMIKRHNKTIQVTRDTMIQKNDLLILFGNKQNIRTLFSGEAKDVNELLQIDNQSKENTVDLIDNYGMNAMAEVHINSIPLFLQDKTLSESRIKDKYHINIMVLKRFDKPVELTKDTTIQEGDSIVVFGPYLKIREAFTTPKEKNKEIEKA